MAGWPLLGGGGWNGFISANGAPPGPVLAYFLAVSPGWADTMKISFLDGRDFRTTDTSPGAAIVNQTFAKQFFNGENPVGKTFVRGTRRFEVIGMIHDAPYRSMREPILPLAYLPLRSSDDKGTFEPIRYGTFIVRTSSQNPRALASTMRQEVPRARPEFRVSNIRTQEELVRAQTVRERLLAMLALFFAVVALLLAAIGLYGVLDYSVLQQRREIGIRIAIGARPGAIARLVTLDIFWMVLTGAVAGLTAGLFLARYIESLLYQVKATDINLMAIPTLAVIFAAILASLPAVIHAVRIDPVAMLRAD
jgi:predicted lysophospholipase L1 biosynthesis ABC-type transport system permease subunit